MALLSQSRVHCCFNSIGLSCRNGHQLLISLCSEPSTSQQTSAVDQSTNISIEHAAPPPRAPPSGPRGLAFDPLAGGGAARRRAQQQGPSLGAGGPNLPALDDTEGLEDLSAGLSQLLAELSKGKAN